MDQSETQLNQRKPGASAPVTGSVATKPFQNQQTVAQFEPDFVLRVLYTTDPKTLLPITEAEMDFTRLIKTLDFNGFKVLIKPDSFDYVLVFVKLIPTQFKKLVQKSLNEDFIYGINSSSGTTKDAGPITNADRARIIYSYLTGDKTQGGCHITVGKGNWSFVQQLMPLTGYKAIAQENKSFKSKLFTFFSKSHDEDRTKFLLANFGSTYAFYFNFISSYMNWLLISGFIGITSNYLLGRYSKIFTVINTLLSIGFYLQWSYKEQSLAAKWKSKNADKIDNYITGITNVDPSWKILLRQALFSPVALGYAVVLVFTQLVCFVIEIFINEIYQGPFKSILALVPTVLISVATPIIMSIYTIVCNKYLAFENHSHNSSLSNSLLVKLFVLNFLASYMALYITSFIYLPFGFKLNSFLPKIQSSVDYVSNFSYYIPSIPIKSDAYQVNQLRLNNQFNFFMTTSQVIAIFLEFGLPVVMSKIFKKKPAVEVNIDDIPEEKELLDDIRSSLNKAEFAIDGEYRSLVVQFGYITLFGSVWPLCSIPCLLADLFQYKLDYLKLTKLTKTAIPSRSSSIQPFNKFMKFLVILGSFTSMSISLMYNGGDITASSDSSSNKVDMSLVLLLSVVAALFSWFIVAVGETIIKEYFASSDEKQTINFKRSVVNEQGSYNAELDEKVEGVYDNSEIDGILKYASSIPQAISIKKEK